MEKNNSIKKNMKLVDFFMNVRLSLSVKRIAGPTIKRRELLSIINEEKKKINADNLRIEIDKVFDEYFDKKEQTQSQENKVISLNDMEQMMQGKVGFMDDGKGTSFIKDKHFNSSIEGKKEAS